MKNRIAFFSLFFLLFSAVRADSLSDKIANKTPPKWMVEQIASDLAGFEPESITTEMLDNVMQNKELCKILQLIRCKIDGQTLTFECEEKLKSGPYFIDLAKAITELALRTNLPKLDFIVSLHDSYSGHPDVPVPVFAFSKDKTLAKRSILIPDAEALHGNRVHLVQAQSGMHKYPWKKKKDLAFWRGATTGGHFTKENYRTYPRSQLVELSKKHPDLINARFTLLVQGAETFKDTFKSLLAPPASVSSHLKYKYQLLIDGNSAAFSRAFWQLYSKCVTFKHDSDYIQWFYGALKPFVHYIPVKRDLSDLPEKLKWAKSNDAMCHTIAKQAYTFFHQTLLPDEIYYYFYMVLSEYAKLQKG